MKSVIQFDGAKFWVDDNIMFCKLSQDFFSNYDTDQAKEIFFEVVSILYNGTHKPFLIDLGDVGNADAYKAFRILSNCPRIKKQVLSKVFYVNSSLLKNIFAIFSFLVGKDVLNKTYSDYNLAVAHCNNDYMAYNI